MYPSSISFEFIFLVAFPPYPAKYPPKILFAGLFDLPMYKMSEVGFPESAVSTIAKTTPLFCGRLEKGSPFKETNSVKPFSLRDREFIYFTKCEQDLTFPTQTIYTYKIYFGELNDVFPIIRSGSYVGID